MMTNEESQNSLQALARNFPRLAKRIAESDLLAQEWVQTLKRSDYCHIQATIRRWLRGNLQEPTLDRFTELYDQIEAESKKQSRAITSGQWHAARDTIPAVLAQHMPAQRSDDDRLWAELNLTLTHKILKAGACGVSYAGREEIRADAYRAIAEQYPQFAGDCAIALAETESVDGDGDIPF